jgi:putative flippase GtrA
MPFIHALIESFRRHRILRFLGVGIVNTGFSYSIYAFCVYLGMHYTVANLVSLVCGILFSFQTQGRFVFQNAAQGLIFRFVAVWAVLYFFNVALIAGFLQFGGNAYYAGALALVPTTILSYFMQKLFVFGSKARPRKTQ